MANDIVPPKSPTPIEAVATAIGNGIKAFDGFFARLFLAASPSPAPGQFWATIAALLGRLSYLTIIVLIVITIASWVQGPVTSTRLVPGTTPPEGVVYALPATVVQVAAKATIVDCGATKGDGQTTEDELRLKLRFDVDATPTAIPDPNGRYVIAAASLHHPILPEAWDITLAGGGTLTSVGYSGKAALAEAKVISDAVAKTLGGGAVQVNQGSGGQLDLTALCRGLPVGGVAGTTAVLASATDDPKATNVGKAGKLWLRPGSPETAVPFTFPDGLSNEVKKALAMAENQLTLMLDVNPAFTLPSPGAAVSASGIVYRYSVPGRLRACLKSCADEVLLETSVPLFVPGYEAAIPVTRGWLGDQSMKLTFDSSGALIGLATTQAGPDGAAPSAPAQ